MLFNAVIPSFLKDYFVIRLLVAAFLGAIIGIERDMHGRAAGVRTNMIVSLGAALFMIISEIIATSFGNSSTDPFIRADPARIAAQIVTGIGFIGAGAIIKSGFTIRGLTTAACLWLSAAIGMSAGAGLYELSILATFIGLPGLIFFHSIEKKLPKNSYRILELTTSNNEDISKIIKSIKSKKVKILYLDNERNYRDNKMVLKFNIMLFHTGLTDKISHEIVENIEKLHIDIFKIRWYH